jgi:hypothetical protein
VTHAHAWTKKDLWEMENKKAQRKKRQEKKHFPRDHYQQSCNKKKKKKQTFSHALARPQKLLLQLFKSPLSQKNTCPTKQRTDYQKLQHQLQKARGRLRNVQHYKHRILE